MASFVRNNPINTETFRIDIPENTSHPIRLAFLGDARTGKTSIISKLSQGVYTDTYYPTHRINSNLLPFSPEDETSLKILNPQFNNFDNKSLDKITTNIVYNSVLNNLNDYKLTTLSKKGRSASDSIGTEVIIHTKNDYYKTYSYKSEIGKSGLQPHVTPIFTELIDTPAFKSDVVPFLESSLYSNLDKSILKNLANEPRRDVLTMPLLVASGAGELNATIDGYFFVYTAVPTSHPPSYDEIANNNKDEDSLSTLVRLKYSLDEAWQEFYTFKRNWEKGKETDIYSFKDAIKNVFLNKNIDELEASKLSKRKFYKDLEELPKDPSNPNTPPPIWIICTNCKNPLSSPKLIEKGKEYAKLWNCGFIGIDIIEDLDNLMSLMIRDIIERKKLQKIQSLKYN